jgi:penicillin-binding protein 2
VLSIYTAALYRLQLYDTVQAVDTNTKPPVKSSRTVTLTADRGDILDRNGVLLVSDRPAYDITLTWKALRAAPNTNEILLSLIRRASESGVSYTDTFPMTLGAPFSFLYDMTEKQRGRLDKYLDYFDLGRDISASDFIVWLKEHYGIDYTTGISDARLVIGVRYELELRVILNISDYIFAEDVGTDLVSYIKEAALPGVNIETTSVREYHTEHAAHLLGYISRMDPDDYEKYEPLGYPMDAFVGKAGAEIAFETYLHGVDGKQVVETGADGTVLSVVTTRETVPGSNVNLSVDIELQAVTDSALSEFIKRNNLEQDEDKKAVGGAVVVTSVNNGEVLAASTYPMYTPNEFKTNYKALSEDESKPLVNRATQGIYNPGSTFKMVTALAGLRAGTITRWTEIFDSGVFTKYEDRGFAPRCWIYPSTGHGHGALNLLGALENSCNYYFYQVADNTGIDKIAGTARDFGFGAKTGIELPESTGIVASQEYKWERFNESWWAADTLLAAIGQSYNMFTPVQLANYIATIANGGTLYEMTILHNVKSSDFSSVVATHVPTRVNTITDTEYMGYLKEGMRAVAATGTASSVFGTYPIRVAAKTGTVQSDTSAVNNGVFVCYAPADDPQIAISVVVENGGSGGAIMEIAKVDMDYYFAETTQSTAAAEGELIA